MASAAQFRFDKTGKPVNQIRQDRTRMAYALVVAAGLGLWLAAPNAALQSFGLGLWAPGLGFLGSGGWTMLLLPLTLALFALSVFFWFAAGAIVFPILIWFGSALLAAGLTGTEAWPPAPIAGALLVASVFIFQSFRIRHKTAEQREVAARKFGAMDQLVAAAKARATPRPGQPRELTSEMLSAARYLLDRSLQPVADFNGFDRVDIFQTASVRYQINFIGYALAILQTQYTPSFHGYLSTAQRNLIEKYREPRVWNYWVYESIWGHLNFTNWDPADKDNIMLTGYFGAQVNLYMRTTGDMRYAEPGSLIFKLNDRNIFPHDAHTINQSLIKNFQHSAYCLYPCEPNWIYPACNFRAMLSLVAYDQVFGTGHAKELDEYFWRSVDTEFTDAAGSIIALRSSITGIPFPFPGSDLSFAPMANVFARDRAMMLWSPIAMGLRQTFVEHEGSTILGLPNKGIDFGNYRRGVRAMAACSIMQIAREFGDDELAEVARNTLRVHGRERHDDGVLSFGAASNMANIYGMQGIFARTDDMRATWLEGPDPASLRGPLLDVDNYPAVLVAAAHSDGEDLRIVLYPGKAAGVQRLKFSRLRPGGRYRFEPSGEEVVAMNDGTLETQVAIEGRLALRLTPVG